MLHSLLTLCGTGFHGIWRQQIRVLLALIASQGFDLQASSCVLCSVPAVRHTSVPTPRQSRFTAGNTMPEWHCSRLSKEDEQDELGPESTSHPHYPLYAFWSPLCVWLRFFCLNDALRRTFCLVPTLCISLAFLTSRILAHFSDLLRTSSM